MRAGSPGAVIGGRPIDAVKRPADSGELVRIE
jgi:hypothetical protein